MGILSIIQIGIFNMDHLDFTNGPFLSRFDILGNPQLDRVD